MARERSHRRRRRRGRFSGIYKLLSVLLCLAAVGAACVVFFRINAVEVSGSERYTDEEVQAASGIELGSNLITLSRRKIMGNIRTALPYVESVNVRRLLPDRVLLTVTERTAAASVESDSGRWLISSRGKLLEQAGEQQVVSVTGLRAVAPYAGGTIQVVEEDETTLEHVLDLLAALEEADLLEDAAALDCSASASLTLTWDIYQLKLPRGGDYSRMLKLLQAALESEKMPQNEPGTFDFTVKDGEVFFKRDA